MAKAPKTQDAEDEVALVPAPSEMTAQYPVPKPGEPVDATVPATPKKAKK